MALKPWREIAVPRDDVCKGTFQQSEFAADISAVTQKRAPPEYLDPEKFFSMTYITYGMKDLITAVLKRISGTGGDPVIQLKTAFGGGKTHSLLAIYHIAKQEKPLSSLQGIPTLLQELNIIEVPKAKIVVIDGTNQNPSTPRIYGKTKVNTLWGDIAWQLGGEDAYAEVKANDLDGTAPTKDIFRSLLEKHGPVVLLMDELVRYIAQFKEGKAYTGGTYDSNLSFIQNLTEAVKQVPNAVLLASLPDSNKDKNDTQGEQALRTLEHFFGRVQTVWRPIETQESFEIIRRRLFKPIENDREKKEICREFSNLYLENPEDFPTETQESSYYNKLLTAYPIHPEFFERLYTDWSSLPNFQRTRGVLRLMAKIISNLWMSGNQDSFIMPGNIPLDSDVKTELLTYLPQGWDPVVEGDIDGSASEAHKIDSTDTRLGRDLACHKVARTIFLGTAPGSQNKLKPGIDKKQILLGVVEPTRNISVYSDALDKITNKFHYLNIKDNNYWFDIRQNLTKEKEEREKRFNKPEIIEKEVKGYLSRILKIGTEIQAVHIFTKSDDIPDDKTLKLIVLPLGESYNRQVRGLSTAESTAQSILKNKGDAARKYQNRLLFLVPDSNNIETLSEQIVSVCAWESIIDDYESQTLTLDNYQAMQARKNKESQKKSINSLVRNCFTYLLVPEMVVENGNTPSSPSLEPLKLNPGSPDMMQEIVRTLTENEFLIREWAPSNLRIELERWYWNNTDEVSEGKFWDDSCRYLYLPRLVNEETLHKTIAEGAGSTEFFGLAYGKEGGEYKDFRLGDSKRPYIRDGSLLLISPKVAAEYQIAHLPPETPPITPGSGGDGVAPDDKVRQRPPVTTTPPQAAVKKRFYASVELNPVNPTGHLMNITEEIIRHFTVAGADVKLSLEIEVQSPKGFDANIQRTVLENCNALSIKEKGFEEE